MSLQKPDYIHTLKELKEKIRQARIRASHAVNAELLKLHWEIGNTILQLQEKEGWGAKIIDKLALDLKTEFPGFKGLSVRNLKYMRAFAQAYPDFPPIVQSVAAQLHNIDNQKDTFVQGGLAQITPLTQNDIVQGLLAQLSWYHHITLLDKIKNKETRLFYIHETIQHGWSRDMMVHHIDGGFIKLYREQLSTREIEYIADTVYNAVRDDGERQLKYIKQENI